MLKVVDVCKRVEGHGDVKILLKNDEDMETNQSWGRNHCAPKLPSVRLVVATLSCELKSVLY